MQKAAASPELRDAFEDHLKQTEKHVTRIEQVFFTIGQKAKESKSPAMKGIVEEGKEIIGETEEGTGQHDIGLIFAGRKTEHHEIAVYDVILAIAKTLEYDIAVDLLTQTLAEEKAADELLTKIVNEILNPPAPKGEHKEVVTSYGGV